MPILTPLSLVLGVVFEDIGGHLLFLVPWLFAFMTFASSLSMNFNDVKSFSTYPKIILWSIAFFTYHNASVGLFFIIYHFR